MPGANGGGIQYQPGQINMGGSSGVMACRAGEYACEFSRKCITENRRCDNYPDCEFGEDEANCQVQQTVVS